MITGTIVAMLIWRIAALAANRIKEKAESEGKVYYEFSQIQEKLGLMQGCLKGAAAAAARIEGMKEWTEQLTAAAYKVEDLLDEFLDQVESHNHGGVIGYGERFLYYPADRVRTHNIVIEVQKVTEEVNRIFKAKDRLVVPEPEHRQDSELPESFPVSGEGETLLGIDGSKDQVVQWLTSPEPQRKVVLVWGMGGLGKTTLVREVYKHPTVTSLFTDRAWVYVTKHCSINELLRNMVNDLSGDASEDQEPEAGMREDHHRSAMRSKLSQLLTGKKYLIILDYVWKDDVFNALFECLPANNNGSRIIVTARSEDVANSISHNRHVLNINPMSQEDATSLFHREAFRNATCPIELRQYAQEIINKCERLPLAIIAIGRVMARKESTTVAWRNMCDRLQWELSNNEMLERVARGLMLSYKSLPDDLQRCFLYCSLFREGQPIKVKWLVRMWVAEGFIHSDANDGVTMEEIGVQLVEKLAARSMLQVVKRDVTRGPKVCRVHDIMAYLALKASQGQNVCLTTADQLANLDEGCRRLSIMNGVGDRVRPSNHLSGIRTLLVLSRGDPLTDSSWQIICEVLKFLRVLDLRDAPIHSLPSHVFDLFNLRYLSLRGTKVGEIHSDVEKLYNLQTLDLWKTNVRHLPRSVLKLRRLRHLYKEGILAEQLHYHNVMGILRGADAPSRISDLSDLQTLKTIVGSEKALVALEGLTQLRHLGVTNLDRNLGRTLCNSINKMKKLSRLSIKAADNRRLMLDGLSPPPHLNKLILNCRLELVPVWFSSLKFLTHLYLFGSWFTEQESPIPALERLPNLVLLVLDDVAYQGRLLHFKSGSFGRLETLMLRNLTALSKIRVENGALSNLQVMYLWKLGRLTAVEGAQYIARLQDLYWRSVPMDPPRSQLNTGVRLRIS